MSEASQSGLEAPGACLTVLFALVGLLVSGNLMSAMACWGVVASESRSVGWKAATIVGVSQSQPPAMGALSEQRRLARQMLKQRAFLGCQVFRGLVPLNLAIWLCQPPSSASVSRL